MLGFTANDVYGVAKKATARTLLDRALGSGDVDRVRRGVYVSKAGKFRGEVPDPLLVASPADPNVVISYHSALVAHGVAHNVGFECSFRSAAVRTPWNGRHRPRAPAALYAGGARRRRHRDDVRQ